MRRKIEKPAGEVVQTELLERSKALVCEECNHRFLASVARRSESGVTGCPECGGTRLFGALDTLCENCGNAQFQTPGGASCPKGHGGANGVSVEEWSRRETRSAPRSEVAEDRSSARSTVADVVSPRAALSPSIGSPEKSSERDDCATCGARLTVTSAGRFWPCGHDPRTASRSSVDEWVEYTWGTESIRLAQYVQCEIGPFKERTAVRFGETRAEARARLAEEVNAFAERERRRKVESMSAALKLKDRGEG